MELQKRILSSIEIHKKLTLNSIPQLFSHEKRFSIYRCLIALKNQKWIKINKSYVEDGYKINQKCVYRTKKDMYKQKKFDFDFATF